MSSIGQVRLAYRLLVKQAQACLDARYRPNFVPKLRIIAPDPAHFPAPRNFAFCYTDTGDITIADDLLDHPRDRWEAILQHEIGHAFEFFLTRELGKREGLATLAIIPGVRGSGPERRADAVAEYIFGDPISYDAEDVQTLGPGTRPRPLRLGK